MIMSPAVGILLSFCCVALLYYNNSIQLFPPQPETTLRSKDFPRQRGTMNILTNDLRKKSHLHFVFY